MHRQERNGIERKGGDWADWQERNGENGIGADSIGEERQERTGWQSTGPDRQDWNVEMRMGADLIGWAGLEGSERDRLAACWIGRKG